VRLVLACTLLVAALACVFSLGQEDAYRARAFVIQVPSRFAGANGVELARTDRVLARAVALSGVGGVGVEWLRRRSKAETTSRLDLAFTVTAPRREDAVLLATGYAKSFRRAIPDDGGLPLRGAGARTAQGVLGPLGWTLLGAFVGFWLGLALAIVRGGLRPRNRSLAEPA
jgi:hypothetical protein